MCKETKIRGDKVKKAPGNEGISQQPKIKYKVTVRSSPRWTFLLGNPPSARVTSNEKHKHGLLFYTSDSWSIMGGNFEIEG